MEFLAKAFLRVVKSSISQSTLFSVHFEIRDITIQGTWVSLRGPPARSHRNGRFVFPSFQVSRRLLSALPKPKARMSFVQVVQLTW